MTVLEGIPGVRVDVIELLCALPDCKYDMVMQAVKERRTVETTESTTRTHTGTNAEEDGRAMLAWDWGFASEAAKGGSSGAQTQKCTETDAQRRPSNVRPITSCRNVASSQDIRLKEQIVLPGFQSINTNDSPSTSSSSLAKAEAAKSSVSAAVDLDDPWKGLGNDMERRHVGCPKVESAIERFALQARAAGDLRRLSNRDALELLEALDRRTDLRTDGNGVNGLVVWYAAYLRNKPQIMVKRLPSGVTKPSVCAPFKEFGAVGYCELHPEAGDRSQLFALLRLDPPEAAQRALAECRNIDVDGHRVEVKQFHSPLDRNSLSASSRSVANNKQQQDQDACWWCSGTGHFARDCPVKHSQGSRGDTVLANSARASSQQEQGWDKSSTGNPSTQANSQGAADISESDKHRYADEAKKVDDETTSDSGSVRTTIVESGRASVLAETSADSKEPQVGSGTLVSCTTLSVCTPSPVYTHAVTRGRAVGHFDPTQYGDEYLELQPGDQVLSTRQDSLGWCFGSVTRQGVHVQRQAWFPPEYVEWS